ncbi:glutathione synthase [Martiniozyma asiatica (nom. inval.)]|nr:glutathione synthase [Martiniozyma asiatica]
MFLDFPKPGKEQIDSIIYNATQFGLANGLIMYPPAPYSDYSPVLAPVTLYPTPFPRDQFTKALRIAKSYNELYANIVLENKWLMNIIDDLASHDKDFTGKLYECYLKAKDIGIPQNVSLALIRNDYMLDEKSGLIKQVEFNTVSVSFGGLSTKVGQLHQFLNKTGQYSSSGVEYYKNDNIQISQSASELARGLYIGVDHYNKNHNPEKETIVLMVVQPNERNAFDQRAVEYALFNNHNVQLRRIDLPKVTEQVKIDPESRKLFYEGLEVSVVYYRSAYGPGDFTTPETWEARVQLETSLAIKCPSLPTQLSGAKKIQQLLTDSEVLNKFIDNNVEEIESTFCAIHPLDSSSAGLKARKLAIEIPSNFVLKPQREGGGNNVYRENIPEFLKSLPENEWEGYILMELIHPKVWANSILRNGEIVDDGIVSELGIFGAYLMDEANKKILSNEELGYLLRSKTMGSDEGGVAAGFGCVDNICLF